MKFTIKKNNLENILIHLQAFLDKKDYSQVTSHIFIQAKDEHIVLKATDYEIGLEVKIPAEIDEYGSATVNGKKILDIIKGLKEGELRLEAKQNILEINQNKSKFKLPMFDSNEFPKTNYNKERKININTKIFTQNIKKILSTISNNNQPISYTGALLELKNNLLSFVASDSRRLTYIRENTQDSQEFYIIIPKKALNEIIKLFHNENIEIFYSDTQLVIQDQSYTLFSRLINDKFPEYERIIPKEFKTQISLPKAEVAESIKQIQSVCNKVRMTLKNKEILFESITDENLEEGQTQIEIQESIEEEISIGFDIKYLLDFLSQIEGDKFTLCLREPNVPFLIKDNYNLSSIILPII